MNDPAHSAAVTVRRVRRLMCLFTALLVASTWPLWIPGSQFPDIPWLTPLCPIREGWWDWIPIAAAAVWLGLAFRGLPGGRARTWVVRIVLWIPIAFALLVDQHRLQPWVWQMLLMAGVLSIADAPTAIRCLRWLTVSIYFHSAVSKIGMAFLDSHGQWLLDGLASSLGLTAALWNETTRHVLAAVFPLGEFVVAATLFFRRTRLVGLVLAITMHVTLLLALGPFGHEQKPAVLLWNVFFIGLDLLLFGGWADSVETERSSGESRLNGARRDDASRLSGVRRGSESPLRSCFKTRNSSGARVRSEADVPARARGLPVGQTPAPQTEVLKQRRSGVRRNRIAETGTLVLVVLPCLSWRGYWDHWPSWAVYSSRPAIVQSFVLGDDVPRLPSSLKPFVGLPQPLSEWRPINVDAWSFETLWCPVYPQERHRLAVANTIAERSGLVRAKVEIRSSPNRWTGERSLTVLQGDAAVLKAYNRRRFWWNTGPRDVSH